MEIGITGASGFIGRRLSEVLKQAGHTVRPLPRRPDAEALSGCEGVVHLAGEPLAQRWTTDAKARIRGSRVDGTRHLVRSMAGLREKPGVLLCASAIGIYGDRGEETLTESSAPGTGFLPSVCVEWEREARAAEALGVRVASVRTGIVLGPGGGALAKMLPPFRAFLGGRLGSGRQWMSWIHIDDLAGLLRFALEGAVAGAINGVGPNPVRNAEFTRELAAVLHRPAIFPVPALALQALFGEMSEVLLGSQRVLPKAALDSEYRFRYADLGPALGQIAGGS